MDASRIRRGEMIAAVAAIALFIIMFLAWFSVPGIEQAEELGINTSGADFNAFDAFDFIKIVMLLTIIAAIALAAISATATKVNLPVALSAIVAGLGILTTLLVLYRVIDPVGGLDRSYGLFLGLLAAAGIAYGGWTAMQDEGTSFQGEADRVQGDRGTGTGSPPPPPPPPSSSGPAA